MAAVARRCLVVLDFSGTLSIAAVRFAEPDTLAAALRNCGLSQVGIDDDVLWNELVNPTWQEGSTTTRGYVDVLTAAAITALRARGRRTARETIAQRVACLARHYLDANRIEPQWGAWLRRFASLPASTVVVATDHYAEATAHIAAELSAVGVDSVPVLEARRAPRAAVLIANSADLGWHKSSPQYWRAVQHALEPDRVTRMVLVDDFGANEHQADAYAAGAPTRAHATIQVLAEVFTCRPQVFAFILDPAADADALDRLVTGAGRWALEALTGQPALRWSPD